jgi:hypothetical protein
VNASQISTLYLGSNGQHCSQQHSQQTFNSYRTLDSKYQNLKPDSVSEISSPIPSTVDNVFYHLISILRFAPLRDLYAYAAWLATRTETTVAGARLSGYIQNDTEHARKCVLHAGAIIRGVRAALTPTCYHYFSLLVAFLYLWSYERLTADATSQLRHFNESMSFRLVRIDRDSEETHEKEWITGNPEFRCHLTGVGLLLEPGNPARLLRECQRILSSHSAWPHLRNGIISCLDELIDEVKPLTDVPYSWTS